MDRVFVDYTASPEVARMVVGGMTVVERVLRDAARSGARAAIVCGDVELPALPLDVTRVPAGTAAPTDARPMAGDVIAGVRITDSASRRAATRALFQTCRRPYDGLGDRYVIRAVSLRLSPLLCRLGVTPNQITMVNIAIGLAACAVAADADGAWSMFALAGGLMFLQVVLDCCDGEVARIRHLHSQFGMLLDNTSDDVIDNLFVAMVGVGLGGIWLPLGLIASAAKSGCAVMIHVDVARQGKPGDVMAFQWFFDRSDQDLADRFEVEKPSLFGLFRNLGRRDAYVLLWLACCLANVPEGAIVHGLALGAVYAVLSVWHLIVTRGRIRRRDARA